MRHPRHQKGELLRMVPRLAVMAMLASTAVMAVGNSMAAPEAIVSTEMLVGGRIAKPNGVGFVLAMGLQRPG